MTGSTADRGRASTLDSGPSPDAVRAQLTRILSSPDFAQSGRLVSFLRFVVEETLAGRGERLKEYTIATEVFGRDESFDPQTNTIVRVEAGRLRRRIERYYLTEGRDDPVRIDLPKGSYVPLFRETHPAPAATPARHSPRAAPPVEPGADRGPGVGPADGPDRAVDRRPAVREPERRSRTRTSSPTASPRRSSTT